MTSTIHADIVNSPTATTAFQPVLLTDLIPLELLKCKECKQPFQRENAVFCCDKCKNRFHNKEADKRLRERADIIQTFQLPSKTLNEQDTDAVRMYQEGKSFCWIAVDQGRDKAYIRKVLINAGVYRKNKKFDGVAKKGTGEFSKILIAKKIEENKAERIRVKRGKVAKCLWALRKGVGITITCRELGFTFQTIYNFIAERPSYHRFKISHAALIDQMAIRRKHGKLSKAYKNERVFGDAIEGFLKSESITHKREYPIPKCRRWADFLISNWAVEIKNTTSQGDVDRAIGQLIAYRHFGNHKTCLVVPDDVEFDTASLALVQAHCDAVMNESTFRAWVVSGIGEPITAIPPSRACLKTAIERLCKCCGNIGTPSRSPSGDARSYCLRCEPTISGYQYDNKADRWLPISPIAQGNSAYGAYRHAYEDSL